ncbi:MAG: SemiSWEET transporter [Chlorobiaceae bacterium]|nr:SemiSWEET transporter [Chlorobiaceae bacterium]NTW09729.1 SemiSWEET transporter [Chlorobiaceae bacterium]
MTETITYIGFAAGIVTTFAFLPQVIRILRTRRTRDISLLWALSMTLGIGLWLLYGIEKNDPPMIAANSISLLLILVILFSKLRYD